MFKQRFLILLLFFCMLVKGQVPYTPKSLLYFKDGVGEMMIAMEKQFENNKKSFKHYKNAIVKFLEAFNQDTSMYKLGIYLPNLYCKFQKFDSSLLWSYKLLRQDSIDFSNGRPNDYLDLLENIGNCNLLLGNLEQTTYYYKLYFHFSQSSYYQKLRISSNNFDTSNFLFFSASNIDKGEIYKQLRKTLKEKNIKTCDYAIKILIELKKIYNNGEFSNMNSIKKLDNKIIEVRKNCK